jgi:hypothetical protein
VSNRAERCSRMKNVIIEAVTKTGSDDESYPLISNNFEYLKERAVNLISDIKLSYLT